MTNDGKTKTLVQVRDFDKDLWLKVRAAAVMEGKSMAEWVEEACRKQLATTEKSKTKGE